MRLALNLSDINDYRLFLKIKSLPKYEFCGRVASFPDEYAKTLGVGKQAAAKGMTYKPSAFLFDYQAAVSSIAIRKRKFAAFVDCLAGETVINTPDGDVTIEEAHRNGKPIRVFAIDNGRVVVAGASCPFVNGVDAIYEFRFSSGRSIRSTLGHRFLSYDGWKRGESLRIGERLAVSAPARLRSTSEPCQPVWPADAHCLIETIQDWMDRCLLCCRPCDEQPLTEAGIVQVEAPSQGDVLECIHQRWRMGAMAYKSARSHQHQCGVRPSMTRYVPSVATIAGDEECQLHACDCKEAAGSIRIWQQAHGGTILRLPTDEVLPSGERRFADDQYPYDDSLIEWDTLTAIHYIRTDVFYDITVPRFECFLANGVWSHNCGFGKTLIITEFAKHAAKVLDRGKCVLIVSPLMVIRQTLQEVERFYGSSLKVDQIAAKDLNGWLRDGKGRIGITNYESLTDDIEQGRLGALIADESSVMKSHYGAWGTKLIELGRGLEWKLACTGTPAPNDRIEYANHAVFLDAFPTVNSFLARFFVNRGQTQERWVLKPHALVPFYRSLSHWCIFLTNPATYGWKDNAGTIPPINVHVHDVDMTDEQQRLAYSRTGRLFADQIGGITSRSVLSQIGKGSHKGQDVATNKPKFIRRLVEAWPDKSTIIWCKYNREQEILERTFPNAGSLKGDTPYPERASVIDSFKAGKLKTVISKPEILGFGLNLQICTKMVFSGLQDSYEDFYQCVKRANRVGSTEPLDVHIPVTDIERPMIETVLAKADRVQQDTIEQERIFKEWGYDFGR